MVMYRYSLQRLKIIVVKLRERQEKIEDVCLTASMISAERVDIRMISR